MSPDLPIQQRVQKNVLFGPKRLLTSWGFNKGCLNVDVDSYGFSVEGTQVLKVNVFDYELHLDWLDEQWAPWKELIDDQEFQNLVEAAATKLKEAQKSVDKGKGKGPSSA